MAEDNRRAPRVAGRGYSGYDRHGNYDPYGDLLKFREVEEAEAAEEAGRSAAWLNSLLWEDAGEPPETRSWMWGASNPDSRSSGSGHGVHAIADRGGYGIDLDAAYDAYDAYGAGDTPRAPELRRHPIRRILTAHTLADPESRETPLIPQAPAWTAPVTLILGPVLGLLLSQTLGAASGPAFAVTAVLATMLAAASVPRRALWWVVPAAPPAVWLTSVAAGLTLDTAGTADADGRVAGLTHATVHAFPVTAAALAAALAVVLAGYVLARGDRAERPDARGAWHA